ncbi:MAG: (d)CMP kinase [Actinomycetota bacterium]
MTGSASSTSGESAVVAIDGPAGSGKSTVARRVAEVTGLAYLDTGAMYRAITLGVLTRDIDPEDREAVAAAVPEIEIEIGRTTVIVDGAAATDAIRSASVTRWVSAVSANPAVRTALVDLQRQWIDQQGGGVLEGRDIGTVVAPGAAVKIFLTASTRERARRRALETGDDIDAVEADIIRRDGLDSERTESPLRKADDAAIVDTTEYSIDEVVSIIADRIHAAGLDTPAQDGKS